jgi:hypothetical protein
MLQLASPRYTRQECLNCGAHTCGPKCGCCGNDHLDPIAGAPAIVPLADRQLFTRPAPLPFTRWAL